MILLFSIIASFVGSLQLGPVNLSVIDTAIHQNRKNAFWVALGGSLPEFIYCFLAVYMGSFLVTNQTVFLGLKIFIIVVLLVLGIAYFFKKNKPIDLEKTTLNTAKTAFKNISKGFSLGILNPQLMPFWLSVQVLFNSYKFLVIDEKIDYFFFILGAGLGAFLLLATLTLTISHYKNFILKFLSDRTYNRILAILFILIALQQIYSLYHD